MKLFWSKDDCTSTNCMPLGFYGPEALEPPPCKAEKIDEVGRNWRALSAPHSIWLPCHQKFSKGESLLVLLPELAPAPVDSSLGVEGERLHVERVHAVLFCTRREQGGKVCPWLEKLRLAGLSVRVHHPEIDETGLALGSPSEPDVCHGDRALARIYHRNAELRACVSGVVRESAAPEPDEEGFVVRKPVADGHQRGVQDAEQETQPSDKDGSGRFGHGQAENTTARPGWQTAILVSCLVGLAVSAFAFVLAFVRRNTAMIALSGTGAILNTTALSVSLVHT